MSLFDIGSTSDVAEKLSPDRRRTEQRNAALARGQHPTGLGRIDVEHTCGECRFRFAKAGHAKTYWKCLVLGPTSGPATDVRLSWPACPFYEEGEPMPWDEAKEWSKNRPPIRRLVEEKANQ